jgi:tRNA(Ile)-lysidine synthetase-like protein
LPGDIFFPYKGAGRKKLQDYFTDCKIPAGDRDKILLAAAGKNILWISGGRGAGWNNLEKSKNAEWLSAEFKKGDEDHE